MKNLAEIDLSAANLEDLEQHHRDRDVEVQRLRGEMAAIKRSMDVHHVRIQTELAGLAPQNLTRVMDVGA